MLPALCFALLALGAASHATGRDVLKAMHDRYAGKWYRTLAFVQYNTATGPDGATTHSVWREYLALPGRCGSSPTRAPAGCSRTTRNSWSRAAVRPRRRPSSIP